MAAGDDVDNPLLTLMFASQRALIGEINGNTAAVTCGIRGKSIVFRSYFFESISEQDRENMGCAAGEMLGDLPDTYDLEEEFLSLQDHKLEVLDFWAFMRAEAEPR